MPSRYWQPNEGPGAGGRNQQYQPWQQPNREPAIHPGAPERAEVYQQSPEVVSPDRAITRPSVYNRIRDRQWSLPPWWAFAVLCAVLLMLTGAAIAVLAHQNPISIVLAPFTSSSANASSQFSAAGAPTATATAKPASAGGPHSSVASPTLAPSGGQTTPAPRAPATATARPVPAPTATATPVPAKLSVTPQSITRTTCIAAQDNFTVANAGGTSMAWSAVANPGGGLTGYNLSPSSGTLAPGQSQVVTVSNITLSGTVTVTAPTAQNSPQQVTITCTA